MLIRHSKPLLQQGLQQDGICAGADGVVIQAATMAGWACGRWQSTQTPAWAPTAVPALGPSSTFLFAVCRERLGAAVGSQGSSRRK